MRAVSGNPAKRASGKRSFTASKRTLLRRPTWAPSSRAGQRLTLLVTWGVLTAIAVPAGWNAGRVADSQYVFIMTSIALPVGLAGVLGAWYTALAVIGGATKIRRLHVADWPAGRRRFTAAVVGLAAGVGLVSLIQWVHDDLPAGLIVAVVAGAAGGAFDVVQLLRKRRR